MPNVLGTYNPYYVFLFFSLIWISDSAAYVFGVNFGKRPLLKLVSPKKSIEGLIGGLIFFDYFFHYFLLHFEFELYPNTMANFRDSYGHYLECLEIWFSLNLKEKQG